ncbi:MAG: extracellular solute-binding protein, partial [Caldilineaceae bacterium]|nr:extracellular solute-binding protein [Caldilineaceae bacterium]
MNHRNSFSRRRFLQLSGAAGAATLLVACAPAGNDVAPAPAAGEAGAGGEGIASADMPALLGADMPGSPNHTKGWTTTLPDVPTGISLEPTTISVTRRVDAQTKFAEGDSLESNPWSRMINKLFGVTFEIAWTWSTTDEANSKYNLALASGDIPDYLETVPINIFVQMVESGALEDITDAWDAYASDRWKAAFADYGELPWTWSKIDGRIYGLPRVEDLAHNDTILWYREDWLETLGLNPPTTLDELHDVAKAIVDAGIGKGAAGTTLGLLANKQYAHTWYGSLDPIWGAYGIIPDHWSKEGDALMFDGIREEMKEPLALLNQWYGDGIFRKDFFTLETSDSIQDLAASQCGLHFTPSWGANLDAVTNDPATRWAFTGIPTGPNGSKGKHTENNFRESPFAFRKGAANIDKVFEITNWMIELTEEYDRRFHGWEGSNYEWVDETSVASTGIGWSAWAIGPIGTRGSGMADPRHIGNQIKYQRDEWGPIPAQERDAMQTLLLDDPTGVQQIGQEARLFILETAADGMITEFQSLPTATMVEKSVDLQKLLDET